MNTASKGILRFTSGRVCPVCGGSDGDPRGQGLRCRGFISGKWCHCSREESAGNAKFHEDSKTYRHRLKGSCPCGVEHAPAKSDPARASKQNSKIECVYQYRDASGRPIFEVVRFTPKGFAQRQAIGNGQYKWSLKGIEPVLYRLP